jgi:hypothetical protein
MRIGGLVLYEELGIEGSYDPGVRIVKIRADLRRRLVRVGGPTATLRLPAFTTSLAL